MCVQWIDEILDARLSENKTLLFSIEFQFLFQEMLFQY